MAEQTYTPALGYRFLTPAYDLVVRMATREDAWRRALVGLIAPAPDERILDVGCGTGTLLLRLAERAPGADLVGLDPDPAVLERARRKAAKRGVRVTWIEGFMDRHAVARLGTVTKVTTSLVLHQTPLAEKGRILTAVRSALDPGGLLCLADYGRQRTALMRILFRMTVQAVDGVTDTQPNADGCLPELIEAAGFRDVQESAVFATPTGSISLYRAVAA